MKNITTNQSQLWRASVGNIPLHLLYVYVYSEDHKAMFIINNILADSFSCRLMFTLCVKGGDIHFFSATPPHPPQIFFLNEGLHLFFFLKSFLISWGAHIHYRFVHGLWLSGYCQKRLGINRRKNNEERWILDFIDSVTCSANWNKSFRIRFRIKEAWIVKW